MNSQTNRWILALIAIITIDAGAETRYHDINGTGASFALPNATDSTRADEILIEDGKRYEIYEFPRNPSDPTYHRGIWLSPSVYYGSAPSIAFEGCRGPLDSGSTVCPSGSFTDNPNVADRVELAIDAGINGSDAEELKLGRRRYISFWLNVNGDTEVPYNWTLIHQVWQRADSGSPPFAIYLNENSASANPGSDPLSLTFNIRNDNTPDNDRGQTIFTLPVQRNTWQRITMQLQPSASTGGQIAIWINNSTTSSADKVYYGPWGYTPQERYVNSQGQTKFIEDEFDIRIGIYRRQQPRRLKLLFDEIRMGNTAQSIE